jgi:hypothetical protein
MELSMMDDGRLFDDRARSAVDVVTQQLFRDSRPAASGLLRAKGRTGLRIAVAVLVALAVLAALVVVLPAGPAGRARAAWSFGAFASYTWLGDVSSIGASWEVPTILPGSPPGSAATWIGAQHRSFIQLGVIEERLRTSRGVVSAYFAWWSDATLHDHSQPLFAVSPGDHISARLVRERWKWRLAIRDATSGRQATFSTGEERRASFAYGEWVQEDPPKRLGGPGGPYPHLGNVAFSRLEVNGGAPASADLYSTWMSLPHGYLGPSRVTQDSFKLVPVTVTPAGARYLRIIGPLDHAIESFAHLLVLPGRAAAWASSLDTATSRLTQALTTTGDALNDTRWSASVRRLVQALTQRIASLSRQTRSIQARSEKAIGPWTVAWLREAHAAGLSGHAIRSALRLPAYESSPAP